MKIFLDMEFTSLDKNASAVSIGLVTEDGEDFYAEFLDYNPEDADQWVKENVFTKLTGNEFIPSQDPAHYRIRGDKKYIAAKLEEWLSQFPIVEIWGDTLGYDWVFFCDLFGGAFSIPKNIYYIPFDLSTLFSVCGVDPDISRELFAEIEETEQKHNALFDAKVSKLCFEKLILMQIFPALYEIIELPN